MNEYEDIIHLPHHVSKKHSQMSMMERAAQFSPFAALTGYNPEKSMTQSEEAFSPSKNITQNR